MDFMEIRFRGMDWIHLAQDRDQWRAVVNSEEPSGSVRTGNSPSSLACRGHARAPRGRLGQQTDVHHRAHQSPPPVTILQSQVNPLHTLKLPTAPLSPLFPYFIIPLRSRDSPLHPVLKRPHHVNSTLRLYILLPCDFFLLTPALTVPAAAPLS
jgi:hypothetical protein